MVSLIAALHAWRTLNKPFWDTYIEQLLEPKDWFSFWTLNCRLSSFHSLVMGPLAPGYAMENKWTFLKAGKASGVAVSPWLEISRLVLKDKNVEGGMGIHMYTNTTHGGNWIIQEAFDNSAEIEKLLPRNAPLSTLRIVTASTLGLPNYIIHDNLQKSFENSQSGITSLSCVFRAGRAGAETDHSSILFDVDLKSGVIQRGTTNSHWYQLGINKALKTKWLSSHDITHHPDCKNVGVTGAKFDNIAAIKETVETAHKKLLPDVPLVGWDIALTTKGVFLLEANLSCNFFQGSFSIENYIKLVSKYFTQLDQIVTSDKDWRARTLKQKIQHA